MIKNLAFKAYSENEIIKCKACGISEIEVLQLHHTDGGGSKQIREIKAVGNSSKFYQWLFDNDYPEGLEVLCANCHILKHRQLKRRNQVL
jgi:hypothetical protein